MSGSYWERAGYYDFFCITTKKIVKRRSFTGAPMPEEVIRAIDSIGKKDGAEKGNHAGEEGQGSGWEEDEDIAEIEEIESEKSSEPGAALPDYMGNGGKKTRR